MLKELWKILSGRYLLSDIINADELICKWLDVYRGLQAWLDYEYATLSGNKKKRRRKTMNAAKLITSELTRLVWSELPVIMADKSVLDFLIENNFYERSIKFSEFGLAGGGYAMKLFSPDGVKLKIDFVPPDCFIPVSYNAEGIYEADFIDKIAYNAVQYIRVEKHRKIEGGYLITSELYEEISGTEKVKKKKMSDIGLSDEPIFIKTDVPLFAYVSTPEANNFSMFSPLGISMYANALDTLESLDIAFDGLQQEIVLGKKRIIVPSSSIRRVVDPQTGKMVQYFDPSDEVFQAFDFEEGEKNKIIDNSVELRIEEISLAIQTLLNILSVQVGFSSGTLSFDGVSMKTATEVISENSKTFRTKKSYENQIGKGILKLLEAVKTIGADYGITTTAGTYTIEWNDSIIEDRNAKTAYWITRLQSGTCTLSEFLIAVDGMSPEEAERRAAKIKDENKTIDVSNLIDSDTDNI